MAALGIITNLPNEVIQEIMVKTDLPTTFNLGLVNHRFNYLMEDEHLWYNKLKMDLSNPSSLKPFQTFPDQPDLYQKVYLAMKSLGLKRVGDFVLRLMDTEKYDMVVLMLEVGFDLETKDPAGNTILIKAIEQYNEDLAIRLINAGSDINARDRWGTPVIVFATPKYLKEVIKLLLSKGVDVNTQDSYELTPLANAAAYGYSDLVELLINADANVDLPDSDGITPLMYAAMNGEIGIANRLLDAGAAINFRNKGGETAVTMALNNDRDMTAEFLRDHHGGHE